MIFMTLNGSTYQFLSYQSIRVRVFLFAFLGKPHVVGSGLGRIQFFRIRTGLGLKKFTVHSSLLQTL